MPNAPRFIKTLSLVSLFLFCHQLRALTALELFRQADKQVQAQDWSGAETSYQELIQMKSNLQEYAHFFYAQLLKNQNRSAEAKVQYKKTLELSPNFKLMVEAHSELAQMALQEKNFAQAKSLLAPMEKRLRHEEKYPDVILNLARAERGLGNSGNFCKWIRKLYSHYPEHPALTHWGLKLQDNSLDNKPIGCSVSSEDQNKRIKNLQWAGLSDEALREINEIAALKTLDDLELDKLRVQYYLHEGDVTKALEILTQHYQDRKSHFGYMITLASAAARAGEMPAAVGSYYAAYKLGGRNKLAKQALYQAAFLSYQFQDYDGAARKFQEFMKAFPTSGLAKDAKWHLAWIRYLRSDFAGAYKSFVELKAQPSGRKKKQVSSDRLNYWMAMSLLRQNKLEEAKPIFEALAQDTLMGYYSIAAQFRLKKLEPLLPKIAKKSVTDSIRQVVRINHQAILPSDDTLVSEITLPEPAGESEESIEVSALKSEFHTERATGESESEVISEAASEVPTGDSPAVAKGNDEAASGESPVEDEKSPFSSPILVKRFERARDLMNLGLQDWAKWDLYDIEKKTSNREYLKSLMAEYEKIEVFQRSSYIGQTTFNSQRAREGLSATGRPLWESTYPKAYFSYVQKFSKLFEVPNELVWGIMRAESQYKKDVISPVGALGLMQVMPGTGMKIAGLIGDTQFQPKKLLEPETAIKIGARYLSRLMKKFENSVPLVAASYNAGPHRVKAWLASFGDLDIDEFVEHIPFLETRNYVKKVVSNFQVYNTLYGVKKDGVASLAEANRVRVTEALSARETWEDN